MPVPTWAPRPCPGHRLDQRRQRQLLPAGLFGGPERVGPQDAQDTMLLEAVIEGGDGILVQGGDEEEGGAANEGGVAATVACRR